MGSVVTDPPPHTPDQRERLPDGEVAHVFGTAGSLRTSTPPYHCCGKMGRFRTVYEGASKSTYLPSVVREVPHTSTCMQMTLAVMNPFDPLYALVRACITFQDHRGHSSGTRVRLFDGCDIGLILA